MASCAVSFCRELPQSLIGLVAYERVARDYSMSMSRYLLQGHSVFGGMIDRQGQRVSPRAALACKHPRIVLAPTSSNTSTGSASPLTGNRPSVLTCTRPSANLRVAAVSRIGVQKTVWEWERPFGSTYTAPGCQKKAESPGDT